MGGPTNYLVPVAILYDHPGLNLEEFKERLLEVTSKTNENVVALRIFNYLRENYGVHQILNLPETPQMKINYEKNINKDFNCAKRNVNFETKFRPIKITNYSFEVLEENIIVNCNLFEVGEYKKGVYLDYWHMPDIYSGLEYQVTDVLSANTILIPIDEDSYEEEIISQRVKCRSVKIEEDVEEFFTLEDALKKYPEYEPKKLWDFTINEGILFPDIVPTNQGYYNEGRINTFCWFKKNNKLYLDINKMMDNLSGNSFSRGTKERDERKTEWVHKEKNKSLFSYTDLILTCEAIRTKNYKFIGYLGPCQAYEDLIYNGSQTLKRYYNAVIDTETSLIAKKENWTNTQLLRYRLENNFRDRIDNINYEETIDTFKKVRKKLLEKKVEKLKLREIQIKIEKENKKDNDELPF
jgi:hypothetical protein